MGPNSDSSCFNPMEQQFFSPRRSSIKRLSWDLPVLPGPTRKIIFFNLYPGTLLRHAPTNCSKKRCMSWLLRVSVSIYASKTGVSEGSPGQLQGIWMVDRYSGECGFNSNVAKSRTPFSKLMIPSLAFMLLVGRYCKSVDRSL